MTNGVSKTGTDDERLEESAPVSISHPPEGLVLPTSLMCADDGEVRFLRIDDCVGVAGDLSSELHVEPERAEGFATLVDDVLVFGNMDDGIEFRAVSEGFERRAGQRLEGVDIQFVYGANGLDIDITPGSDERVRGSVLTFAGLWEELDRLLERDRGLAEPRIVRCHANRILVTVTGSESSEEDGRLLFEEIGHWCEPVRSSRSIGGV